MTSKRNVDGMKVLIIINIDVISLDVLESDLVSGLLGSIAETELATLPDDDLILKTDQNRFGFTFRVVSKGSEEGLSTFLNRFLTEFLRLRN